MLRPDRLHPPSRRGWYGLIRFASGWVVHLRRTGAGTLERFSLAAAVVSSGPYSGPPRPKYGSYGGLSGPTWSGDMICGDSTAGDGYFGQLMCYRLAASMSVAGDPQPVVRVLRNWQQPRPLWGCKKTGPGTRWISPEHSGVRRLLLRYLIIEGLAVR
ncbi:hypothetical protein Purlil1_13287 [Purpureocillium lilacinum]|uniref:Uncharacterized protein n=1 Tax=Purpureocillium lilacinum TaxID=33203 RepID=A0ABR0BEJ2_PURLI|nr:hypothetical protein Purlil1_13287 [Purpureocillium lilacinum]